MSHYFQLDYRDGAFVFFSKPHWIALMVLLMIYTLLFYSRQWFREPFRDKAARYFLAAVLILQEVSLNVWRLSIGSWSAGSSLPLHLCGAAIVLSAIMLVNKNQTLYEITYFWGLGGALQALITPDIGIYGYPHYRFFQFFVSHGLIILASLYMTFVLRYRPSAKSILRVFGITNIYMVFIGGFNWLTHGNYLFICHKPENGSLIDFLGPWPWYILSLEVVALVFFSIYYTPFAVRDYWTGRRSRQIEVIE